MASQADSDGDKADRQRCGDVRNPPAPLPGGFPTLAPDDDCERFFDKFDGASAGTRALNAGRWTDRFFSDDARGIPAAGVTWVQCREVARADYPDTPEADLRMLILGTLALEDDFGPAYSLTTTGSLTPVVLCREPGGQWGPPMVSGARN